MRFSHYTLHTELAMAVNKGLSAAPKTLPSWILYDSLGDKIFQSIMAMPEYYPTRCEVEILQQYKKHLMEYFAADGGPFQLIELGAGDAVKTEILLKFFHQHHVAFSYLPVD